MNARINIAPNKEIELDDYWTEVDVEGRRYHYATYKHRTVQAFSLGGLTIKINALEKQLQRCTH